MAEIKDLGNGLVNDQIEYMISLPDKKNSGSRRRTHNVSRRCRVSLHQY